MEAKLNIVVAELSGQYQDKLSSYRPITHMYLSVPICIYCIRNQQDDNNKQHQISPHQSIHRVNIHEMYPRQI